MDSAAPQFDYFLRQSAVLGLAFVFLAGVLGIILWVAVVVVRVLNKYLVAWFESSIESHRQVSSGIRRVTRFVLVMYRNNKTTNDALYHAVMALDLFLSAQPAGLGLSSKAMDHIRYARHILKRRDEHEQQAREEEEREQRKSPEDSEVTDKSDSSEEGWGFPEEGTI